MNEIILLKLGELVLKGLNRRTFEDRLVANARRRLQAHGKFKVYTKQSTMYVEPQSEDCDLDGAWEAMTKLFGVVGLSRARACAKDKDAMLQTAVEYLGDRLAAAKTFKVESKRADKNFPMTSIQLSQYVGGELDEKYPNLTVDVHHPELTVYLEVRDYAAYVHADPEPGAGGLPVGVGGRAVSLLSGGIDSPVASWMIAKRGIALEMVHFFSYPYTSEEAKQKVLTLAKLLTPWCGRLTVHVVPFTAIQEELRRKCPEELFTVLMRRFMMRIAEAVAQRCGAGAIVTGECLGQVASQTMEAMRATTAVTTLPILRPVVGMDKEEIVRIARRINTFETSILPYEDCCTVFTPRHPRLRPVLGELEAAEAALDVEGLVKAAVDGIERGESALWKCCAAHLRRHPPPMPVLATGGLFYVSHCGADRSRYGAAAGQHRQHRRPDAFPGPVGPGHQRLLPHGGGRQPPAAAGRGGAGQKPGGHSYYHRRPGPHLRRSDQKRAGRVLRQKAGVPRALRPPHRGLL